MTSWTQIALPALIGAIVALAGVIITTATTRAGWRRELEREHQRWSREQRIAAYLDFLDQCWGHCVEARDLYMQEPSFSFEIDFYDGLLQSRLRVQLFGSRQVATQAAKTINDVMNAIETDLRGKWAGAFIPGGESNVLQPFIDAVRRDLGIPENAVLVATRKPADRRPSVASEG